MDVIWGMLYFIKKIMKTLRIKFVDFWFGFSESNNYLYNILKDHYIIQLVDDPDILIYSCYGTDYLKYKCTRIFYTAENLRPDFLACDYAISFDYNSNKKHLRLPLYAMYIDNLGTINELTKKLTATEAKKIWDAKTKFCCMVVSNVMSQRRLNFYKKLNNIKKVDSGGKWFNNVGGPVKNKMEFIKDYRFVLSFENSSHAGYTTEKLIEPIFANSIPIYWGDPQVGTEFNTGRFIHLSSSKRDDEIIKEIMEIEGNEKRAIDMLMSSTFANNSIPMSIQKENVLNFFRNIFDIYHLNKPVAGNQLFTKVHRFKMIKHKVVKKVMWHVGNFLNSY